MRVLKNLTKNGGTCFDLKQEDATIGGLIGALDYSMVNLKFTKCEERDSVDKKSQ